MASPANSSAATGTPLRVVLLGTPDVAVQAFAAVAAMPGVVIPLVVCQPARPTGRRQELTPSPVEQWARSLGLPVATPTKMKAPETLELLQAAQPDVLLVCAYGRILPQSILDVPRIAPINIHYSLLPRWRGASPVQGALLAGDTTTGITWQRMVFALDEGEILHTVPVPIPPLATAGQLLELCGGIAAQHTPYVLQHLQQLLPGTAQDAAAATYSGIIAKEDGQLHPHHTMADALHRWQAYTPWPGVWLDVRGTRISIKQLQPWAGTMPTGSSQLATTADAALLLRCADGALCITELQTAGSKAMLAAEWLRGNGKFIGRQA